MTERGRLKECINCIHKNVCKFAEENVAAGTKVREIAHECKDFKAIPEYENKERCNLI